MRNVGGITVGQEIFFVTGGRRNLFEVRLLMVSTGEEPVFVDTAADERSDYMGIAATSAASTLVPLPTFSSVCQPTSKRT